MFYRDLWENVWISKQIAAMRNAMRTKRAIIKLKWKVVVVYYSNNIDCIIGNRSISITNQQDKAGY